MTKPTPTCRAFLCVALVAVQGCSDSSSSTTDGGPRDGDPGDAGADATHQGCPGSFPFLGPDCCNTEGQRLATAKCKADIWQCEAPGTVCLCGGTPQQFVCSDACGSDAFEPPICAGDAWACEAGMLKSSDCPANTCWGYPGSCCDADGTAVSPICNNGSWQWAAPCAPKNCP